MVTTFEEACDTSFNRQRAPMMANEAALLVLALVTIGDGQGHLAANARRVGRQQGEATVWVLGVQVEQTIREHGGDGFDDGVRAEKVRQGAVLAQQLGVLLDARERAGEGAVSRCPSFLAEPQLGDSYRPQTTKATEQIVATALPSFIEPEDDGSHSDKWMAFFVVNWGEIRLVEGIYPHHVDH